MTNPHEEVTPETASEPAPVEELATYRRGSGVVEVVLRATAELLVERGYAFSIDEVAERAQVHKTTVYRRWRTKPALVAAAIATVDRGPELEAPTGHPLTCLEEVLVAEATRLRAPDTRAALRALLSATGEEPELTPVVAEILDRHAPVALEQVAAAMRQGILRHDLVPERLWALVVAPLHLAALTGGPLSDEEATSLLEAALEGARPFPYAPRSWSDRF